MNIAALTEEIADVLTVIDAIVLHAGIDKKILKKVKSDKTKKKGKFYNSFMINRGTK